MHAETIAIGTELTTGAKLDTNSQWLSLELAAVGIPVMYHTTVADDLPANVAVLRAAVARADIVLVTGGLGPTLDDLTREALAQVLETKLELHEPSLQIIRGMFAKRQRVMPERNVVQAMFPQGTDPIPNPRGTAPGIFARIERAGRSPCYLFAMPGVPSEMRGMFQDFVLPQVIASGHVGKVIKHARVQCFGLGESAAEEKLGDITARNRDPEVGITVHEATITLRIVAEGASVAECDRKIAETKALIEQRLGDYVYGIEDEELEDVVTRMLRERQQTIATAECVTGGLLAYRLGNAKGSDHCFQAGTVLPREQMLADLVSPEDEAAEPQWATPAAAEQLAELTRERCQADYALSITPSTIPLDVCNGDLAPLVYIGLSTPDKVFTREVNMAGDVTIQKSRTVKTALNLLRLWLLRGELPNV